MKKHVDRRTVDLSAYPDLVVIYLGMRVNGITGMKTAMGLGPQIDRAVGVKPDGLLLHETFMMSLFPPHMGMRQYWRDFESMERWARSEPHMQWWKTFIKDSGGTGFWHETYFMRGGMEAVYDDMPKPIGFGAFTELVPARGGMFSARGRMRMEAAAAVKAPLTEQEVYDLTPDRSAREESGRG